MCSPRSLYGRPIALLGETSDTLSISENGNYIALYSVGGLCGQSLIYNVTANCTEDCNDGIDNDGDGLIDANDPDCDCQEFQTATVTVIENGSLCANDLKLIAITDTIGTLEWFYEGTLIVGEKISALETGLAQSGSSG